MKCVVHLLIGWPERIAQHFLWAGPLVARIVTGYVFLWTGWYKLNNLPAMIENFRGWGIPFPEIMTPLVSGIECFGGALLMVGLLTRIAGGALAVIMAVAILSAKASEIDSLETLLGFEESMYFALFFWLAIAGAGKVSLDAWLARRYLAPTP
jgi:putative oxidoreductase